MARKLNFDLPVGEGQASPTTVPMPATVSKPLRPLLGLERTSKPASALGAISQSLGGISEKVKRADEIEQKLLEGQVIVQLDPNQVDGSFVADRMEASAEENAAFRELIREHGQKSPILVRPHPEFAERYQVAFGHRRLRAARELGIKVNAVVRILSDEELVVAQGQENSGRTDLTFIERARFAARLEERQFSREVIMAALNVDKAAASRFITIATRTPGSVIEAVGPAPSFGRGRWTELLDLIELGDNRQRAVAYVETPDFKAHESDKRFEALVAALKIKTTRARPESWTADDGTHAAKVMRAGKKMTLTFDDRVAPQFGDFVKGQLQSLYEQYKAEKADA